MTYLTPKSCLTLNSLYSLFGKTVYYPLHNNASFSYSLSLSTFHFLQISPKVIFPVLEYTY